MKCSTVDINIFKKMFHALLICQDICDAATAAAAAAIFKIQLPQRRQEFT